MAKSKINRKQIRRLKQKQNYSVATQVRLLAEQLQNQSQLDTCLKQQADPVKRRAMYDFMVPFLKFAGHHCPSDIIAPGLIIRP